MIHGENKAHTATANRIAQVFGVKYNAGEGHDIEFDGRRCSNSGANDRD